MQMFLLAAASVVVAPVPTQAEFGQWIVTCDNGRYCEAVGLPKEDGSDSEWTVHVSRKAKAEELPSGGIGPAFGDDGPDVFSLRIDGRSADFRWSKDRPTPGDVTAMLRAIAAAHKVEVVDGKGKAIGTVPTTGASAALRWMDDRQKRAGTVTAVIARGPRPASSVPPPPALPTIGQPPVSSAQPRKLSASDISAIQALAKDWCDPERAEATTYRLDAQHTVGIVGCMLGAYQGASLVVVIDETGKWRPAPIEQPEPPHEYWEPYNAYVLTGADYIESERLLFSAAKGRGLADCGQSASWAWDGKMFRLARYVALHECRGAAPGEWLSRWQTTNDPLPGDW